ncbi:MAG: FxsA family protein [Candidatus Scalindua sp.]|nr:FxsA family protein [Candidatus Scalindua sp.]
MLIRLIILFTVVPLGELYLLLCVGKYLGVFYTIMIVLITGILGGFLARSQGLSIYRRIRMDLESGIIPTDGLLDGLFILAAGALLLTPGLITDIVGFLFLIPGLRNWLQKGLKKRFKRNFETRHIRNYSDPCSPGGMEENHF